MGLRGKLSELCVCAVPCMCLQGRHVCLPTYICHALQFFVQLFVCVCSMYVLRLFVQRVPALLLPTRHVCTCVTRLSVSVSLCVRVATLNPQAALPTQAGRPVISAGYKARAQPPQHSEHFTALQAGRVPMWR